MTDEKTLKEEIQEFYLNGGIYDEIEIDLSIIYTIFCFLSYSINKDGN